MNKNKIHLLVSYTWEYDKEFTDQVKKIFEEKDLSILVFNSDNIDAIASTIRNNEHVFDVYLDRASDVDENFNVISELLKNTSTYMINPIEISDRVVNKSYMHPIIEKSGMHVPKTFIIPPLEKNPALKITEDNIDEIGRPFIIKPSYYTGGGEGVIRDAYTIEDIKEARKNNPDDHYLVQQKIYPKTIDGKRAWFRIIWAFGEILITYWDDIELVYSEISEDEIKENNLGALYDISKKLAELSELDYFSTEVAVNEKDELLIIDYVNDQCDFRLKSFHPDGVPEKIVDGFIESLIRNLLNR